MRDWIESRARIWADRTALVDASTDRVVTYAALDDRARRLARTLHERCGVGGGDRVALLAHNRPIAFELLFACAKLGATVVPLSWRLAPRELADVVAHCEPSALLWDEELAELAAAAVDALPRAALARVGTDGEPSVVRHASNAPAPEPLVPESVAMVLYTSGTTGRAKGAMLTWRQLEANAVGTTLSCDLGPTDRCLAFLPLFHTGGLNCLATPLLFRGGSVVLMRRFDAEESLRLLERHAIETTIAVPTMYQMLLEAGLEDRYLPRLRAMLCGGAPCPEPLIERLHAAGLPLRQGYGSTEVGPNCFTLSPLEGPHRVGSVGHPVPHGEVRLVDEDGAEVAVGETGELQIRGPHVTAGYLHAPEETRRTIDAQGWLSTGDLARRTEDGVFYIAGRKKEMFISGGENVYPAEVENALAQHPAVRAVAVVGVPHERWGQVGMAVVVPCAPIGADELGPWLRERIAAFKVPRTFRFVDALPTNSTGKVQKHLLAG